MTRGILQATMMGFVLLGIQTLEANDPRTALQTITIPSIELVEVPLGEALEFLQLRTGELSGSPSKTINFILQGSEELRKLPISIHLQDVSLGQVLWFIGEIGKLRFDVDRHAVIVSQPSEWKKAPVRPVSADQVVSQKVNGITLPQFELAEVPFSDAVALLRASARELDPEKRGVNMVLIPDPNKESEAKITLKLSRIPLAEAIRYTAQLAGYEISLENGAIVFTPKPEPAA